MSELGLFVTTAEQLIVEIKDKITGEIETCKRRIKGTSDDPARVEQSALAGYLVQLLDFINKKQERQND
jgi:ribosomal protein S17E